MLSHVFDVNKETYKKLNMQTRIIYDIISARANAKFSAKVGHILAERNWGKDEFDPNDRITSREMHTDLEAAIYTEGVLANLYKNEYGEIDDEVKEKIESIASEYANIALQKCGWIKEEVHNA